MAARLSVVVPFFNVERYIAACLRSLQQQSFGDLEVILVDDGSLDGSSSIAERFVDSDPRFRLVQQENQGLGPARNAGLAVASGDLLTFVDSDDFVPPGAYDTLVRALEVSGSDFAAGNAWRFNSYRSWRSYSHRDLFTRTRLATHINEFPELGLDRMAWNKVFRREFWDAAGLSFPAMLYEDFPVSIAAHARASRVDVVSDPVYYWRERDGGELSITQRHLELANLRDRVTSAEMVLDVVELEAPAARGAILQHLLHIDLSALAVAVSELAGDDPAAEAVGLAERLAARIPVDVVDGAIPFERVQHHLLIGRRVAEVRRLVDYRAHRGTLARVVREGRIRPKFYADLPGFLDAGADLPRELFQVSADDLELTSRLEDATWIDGAIRLELTCAPAALVMGPKSSVEVWLEHEDGDRLSLSVTRHRRRREYLGEDMSGVGVLVNPVRLTRRGFWRLQVRVRTESGIRLEGTVSTLARGRGNWAASGIRPDGWWVQPRAQRGDYGLSVARPKQWASRCVALGEVIEVMGRLAGRAVPDHAELALAGGGESGRYPVSFHEDEEGICFTARLPAKALLLESEDWSPVEAMQLRPITLVVGGNVRPLPAHPDFTGAVVSMGRRAVMATRDTKGSLAVIDGPVVPCVYEVGWKDRHTLRFLGVLPDKTSGTETVLLRRYVTPRDLVEVEVDMLVRTGVFTLEVDVLSLDAAAASASSDPHPEGREATPWFLLHSGHQGITTFTFARETAWLTAAPRLVNGRMVRLLLDRQGVRVLVD